MDIEDLEISGIIAFDGVTKKGLCLHPDGKHLLYAMGNKVTIKNIDTSKQNFLSGHTNLISTLCVSPCGRYIASGQVNHLGFKAIVIVWDYETLTIKGKHEIHKVRVEDVCFSCKSNFLISLGGRDDGHIVIWDVENNEAICGAFSGTDISGNAFIITRCNLRDKCFMTAGDRTIKVWHINTQTRKVLGTSVKVGKLKRSINSMIIDEKDEEAYCGTTSGDIVRVRLNYDKDLECLEPAQTPVMVDCYSKVPSDRVKLKFGEGDPYIGGVTSLAFFNDGRMIVGAGNGVVELIQIAHTKKASIAKVKPANSPSIQMLKQVNVGSAVSSIILLNKCILVSTINSEIYQIKASDFDVRLLLTCHTNVIYDVTFPRGVSEIFATCSKDDIRVWRLETQKELLRITIWNFVCTSLCFSYDGKMLISAWNDGIIRAFTPQTGQMIFAILDAHLNAVSAVAITDDGKKLISGGNDGQVRLWRLRPQFQELIEVLKEHRGPITSLNVSVNNEEVISSSTDGTCIVWDIVNNVRKQILMRNTMFMAARFSMNGIQILTCGTDHKIAYWETLDGSLVREIEGSGVGALNCVDVSPDGKYFVTGSNDCIVKLWDYHLAETLFIGMGHAAIITACKFTPNGKFIVTVSADGAIIIWKFPLPSTTIGQDGSGDQISVRSKGSKQLDLDKRENVAKLTARSEAADSVKTFHQGSKDAKPCRCDPLKPSSNICQCGDHKAQALSDRPAKSHSDAAKTINSNRAASAKLFRPSFIKPRSARELLLSAQSCPPMK